MMTSTMRIYLTVALVLVAIDQFSKYLTELLLPLQNEVSLLPFLGLYRTYNEGVAFSFLSGLGSVWLSLGTMCIIAFLFWLWSHLPKERILSHIGYSFILGGAVGNLIDRMWLGKVVDMIYFHIDAINFHFAIFNLADSFITIGAASILLDEILQWRKSKSLKETNDE